MSGSTIIVNYSNHFDLVWRRGWQRSYEHEGLVYRSYADLWEAWTDRALRLAEEEGSAFMHEQALTIRDYLRRHPDALPVLRRLVQEGRFELRGGGEAVIDVNLCGGETMARNLASGVRFARDVLGQETRFAYHGDGFGSSAQFPQIARQCGLRGIDGLSYCRPDAQYWRGLDGSTVFTQIFSPGRDYFYAHCFYEPCLACGGHGARDGVHCPRCEGTGLRLHQGYFPPREWVEEPVPPLGYYHVGSEEQMPDPDLPRLLRERPAEPGVSYEWGTMRRLEPLWSDGLSRVDDPSVAVSSRVENNPVMTGCFVSRIRSKLGARQAEAWFYAAEKLVSAGMLAGAANRGAAFDEAWLLLPLLFFHDAVTGTHNDFAHAELLDMARRVEDLARGAAGATFADLAPGAAAAQTWDGDGTLTVFNPHACAADLDVELPATGGAYRVTDAAGGAQPVYRQPEDEEPPASHEQCIGPGYWDRRGEPAPRSLRFLARQVPPLGTAVLNLRAVPSAAWEPITSGRAELDGIEAAWDERGVRSLRFSGSEILDGAKGPAGHLIVEKDEGDPWGTRSLDKQRVSYADAPRLLRARRSADAVELIFAGEFSNGRWGFETDPRVFALYWRQTVRLLRGLPWVEFEYDIFWQAVDRRIRICFPSRSDTDRGLYEIPGGLLERERYEQTETGLWSGTGDWPSVGLTATLPGKDAPGIALLNQGTPSMRIEDGVLMCSVLRAVGFYQGLLRTAQEYPMPLCGMRDSGRHQFRFALLPHTGDNRAELLRASARFNAATPIARTPEGASGWTSGIALDAPGVEVTALKQCFSGKGLALRVVEYLGRERTVVLRIPASVRRVRIANLIEEPAGELPVRNREVEVPLRAFGIHTLLLEMGGEQLNESIS